MTTQPSSLEAVEAAIAYSSINHRVDAISEDVQRILWANVKPDCTGYSSAYALTAARILADEVERLRAQAGAVCEATISPKRIGPVVVFTSLQACGAIHSCGDRPIDYVKNPYCPGCGRKVKIQQQTTTNNQ